MRKPAPVRGAHAATLSTLVAAALAAFSAASPVEAADKSTSSRPLDPVARGQYLVDSGGCHDCHTPMKMGPKGPEPDMSRALSGHPEQLVMPPAPKLPEGPWLVVSAATNTAFAGPWGVSFTANLTPDHETGTGEWTQRDFLQTFRTGRHLGRGRQILPPMPIVAFNHLTDEDLASIYAYLRTVPAIRNRVPEPAAPMAK